MREIICEGKSNHVLTWAEIIWVMVSALTWHAIAGALQPLQLLAKYLFK